MTEDRYYREQLKNIIPVRDQYNTDVIDVGSYSSELITDAELVYAPKKGQTLNSYMADLNVHIKYCERKNISAHINGPKGAWRTHKFSNGCFMCEDQAMIHVLYRVLGYIFQDNPNYVFKR